MSSPDNIYEMNKPLVSIICGFYNRELGVDVTLPSLIRQTYQNIEIIVFDDCSTDATLEKIRAFADRDTRVKLLEHDSNVGFVNGLINAIQHAKGDFVAIQGAGDESLPPRIEMQVEYLITHPEVGVVSCHSSYKRVINDEWYVRNSGSGKVLTSDIVRDNPLIHGAAMIRKRMYDEIGGYRSFFKYSQDRDLWSRMTLKHEVHVLPRHLYLTYPSTNGVSVVNRSKILQKYYSKFVNQLIEMRMHDGQDFVDLFGDDAKFFMDPTLTIVNIRRTALKQLYHNKLSDLAFLLSIIERTGNSINDAVFVKLIRVLSQPSLIKYVRRLMSCMVR